MTLRAGDLVASARFHDTVLRTLGVERTHTADWLVEWDAATRRSARGSRGRARSPSSTARRLSTCTWAFPASDRAAVDAFHRTATGAGYADNGAPGERPEYHPGYYGGYVCDSDGNNIELVFHDRS